MFKRSIGVLSSFGRLETRHCSSSTMNRKLEGKVALVTGSTAGIGFAIARRLGQDGAKVVVSSRRRGNVRKAVEQLEKEGLCVHGVVCNVGNKEQRADLVKDTISTFGGIDIVVANAGINPAFGSILDIKEEAWDKIFDVNLKSTFLLCRDAVPSMEERGGGSMIMVSSIVGHSPVELIGAYSVSKTALLGLTKVLSKELAGRNIRVNSISPGFIRTDFSQAIMENETMSKQLLSGIPLNRFGVADDCSGICSFLASEDSSYVTGENIVVAGGMPSRL